MEKEMEILEKQILDLEDELYDVKTQLDTERENSAILELKIKNAIDALE